MSVMGTIGQSEPYDPDTDGCAACGVTSTILSKKQHNARMPSRAFL